MRERVEGEEGGMEGRDWGEVSRFEEEKLQKLRGERSRVEEEKERGDCEKPG